jgi:biopolymer transport protein ExbB
MGWRLPDTLLDSLAMALDLVRAGGPVMVPLVALSLIMWLLILERAFFFHRLNRRCISASQALSLVKANQMPERKHSGMVGLLVAEFLLGRTGKKVLDRHIMDAAAGRLNRRLSRSLAVIGVLAAMAPLMGLLGTVTGMIATFDVLSVFGTGNARAMAGGISEALITTQTGLIVAIPGLYMKGFLDRRAQQAGRRITRAGLYLKRHI